MNKLAIFASGSGSNAQKIAEYFDKIPGITIDCVLTNNKKAYVLERFKGSDVDLFVFEKDDFYNTDKVLEFLKSRDVTFIILAGFLLLVPENILENFEKRIINVHPALLPKYGGKGMFGMKVHEAVVAAGETETGITIHYVDGRYDEGDHIFQAKCQIEVGDSAEDVARKVHELEYEHFPKIIEKLLKES